MKQYAGLPEDFIQKEKDLQIDIGFYTRKVYEEKCKEMDVNSTKLTLWEGKLFGLHEAYNNLYDRIRRQYPEYYNLKYQTSTATLEELQKNIEVCFLL